MTSNQHSSKKSAAQIRRRPNRILVPVSDSETMEETVRYAANHVRDDSSRSDPGVLRLVAINPKNSFNGSKNQNSSVLEQAIRWAQNEINNTSLVRIEADVIGENTSICNPDNVGSLLNQESTSHGIGHVILDPNYAPCVDYPNIQPVKNELAQHLETECIVAPIRSSTSKTSSLGSSNLKSFITTFGMSFVFYQLLAANPSPFNLVTGAITSIIVAGAVSRLVFVKNPTPNSIAKITRALIYFPFLLLEILKANIRVARLILQPDMPIQPKMVRIRPDVDGSLPLTTLGNSITLTPGTLTVRVDGDELVIHAIDDIAYEDLLEGGLERWTNYVFQGKNRGSNSASRGEAY